MIDNIAIKVDNVSKDFRLPHASANSVKSLITGFYRRNTKDAKAVEVQHALKNINFDVKEGEFFGIVGRNGSGKSTLLKILAGIYQPNSGSVTTKGRLVPFIELGVGFNPELTGRENVYLNGAMLGFSTSEISSMYDDIVAFAELERFMDQKLKNYSSGMQVRLAFSMATRADADILLVDEVLAVGDADFQRKCFDYFKKLKKNKKTVILVTHDMNAVREYCDRAVLIDQSEIVEEGTANDISASYSKMFIESAAEADGTGEQTRWGDGALKFTRVAVDNKKLTASNKFVTLNATIKAHKDIEGPIVGFLLKSSTNVHLIGTNSMIMKQPLPDMKSGDSLAIQWQIPNIFNDGVYYIDPAIVYKGGTQVADWWEEAASFRAVVENSTPYAVNPEVKLTVTKA